MSAETENLHQEIAAALERGDDSALEAVLTVARAADIAESFELLSDENRSHILFALPPRTAAEVIVMLDEAVRGDVVDDLDTDSLGEIVSELPPDDAADVLRELSESEVGEILEHIASDRSDKLEELLDYEEETAGGIMTPDVVAVPASETVADAVDHVRRATTDEELHEIYVVDEDQTLLGIVPLRRLVTSPGSTRLEEICDPDVVTVLVEDDQETVVQIIRKYDVMAAAVVDAGNRLIGRITHDDLLDVAEEEAAEDMYRMAGTDAAEFETSSVWNAARIRLTWLLPCMLGMLITASVLGVSKPQFNKTLFAAIVLFVPMIGAMGGNSGIQISTVIVRGFATGDLGATRFMRALAREGRIALIMSVICGLVAWALVAGSVPILQSLDVGAADSVDAPRLAIAVGSAMSCAILTAAMLGLALPFSFRRIGVDPAIASGPLVTTTNDIVSVAIYMYLAMLIAR